MEKKELLRYKPTDECSLLKKYLELKDTSALFYGPVLLSGSVGGKEC